MLKKIIIAVLFLAVFPLVEKVVAANPSFVSQNAARPATCPIVEQLGKNKCSENKCRSGTIWQHTYNNYQLRMADYFISHLCYRPSCYYQAIKYANEAYYIQPLTENANFALAAINSINLAKLNTSRVNVYGSQGSTKDVSFRGGSTGYSVQDGLDFRPTPNGSDITNIVNKGANGVHIQTTPPRYRSPLFTGTNFLAPRTSDDMPDIEPGGGTSAIQGLLWSWRLVSNNWEGRWSGVTSNYGAATPANLPDRANLKNIIIISDGADTDGYVDPVTGNNVTAGTTVNVSGGRIYYDGRVNNEMGQALTPLANNLAGESCDAHSPIQSITAADYQNLCNQLYDQGIRVHVIYYGYSAPPSGDQKLGYCAARTRGLIFNNETNLANAFNQIFAAIAAQNVRLVKD